MPRVSTKKKNKAGKPYECIKCDKKIVAGEEYYEWSFYRSSPTRQHKSHGYPKQSQLTSSKMSAAYAAIEGAEADVAEAACAEDVAQALETCAEEIGNLRDEYQEGLDALPDGLRDAGGPGGETQEKIDTLESFADTLNDKASEIRSEDQEEKEQDSDFLDRLRDMATEALGEFSL